VRWRGDAIGDAREFSVVTKARGRFCRSTGARVFTRSTHASYTSVYTRLGLGYQPLVYSSGNREDCMYTTELVLECSRDIEHLLDAILQNRAEILGTPRHAQHSNYPSKM
jgi:hypothetical protein